MLLVSCTSKETPTPQPSEEETSSSEIAPSSETISSIDPSTSEEEASSQESSQETSSPSGSEQESWGDWVLTLEDIPTTTGSAYNYDFDFSTTDHLNNTISFHGDLIQRGGGDHEGTIQMKKLESYFYLTSGYVTHLEFTVKRNATTNGDFTGVPTVYDGGMEGEAVTLESTISEDQKTILYKAEITSGSFALTNESSFALYLYSVTNVRS